MSDPGLTCDSLYDYCSSSGDPLFQQYADVLYENGVTSRSLLRDGIVEQLVACNVPDVPAADLVASFREKFARSTVAVYYDYQSIPLTQTTTTTLHAINAVRSRLSVFGSISVFNIYVAPDVITDPLHAVALQDAGANIISVPGVMKRGSTHYYADKLIIVDALMHAYSHIEEEPVIVIVSADSNYAPLLSKLNNMGCRSVIVTSDYASGRSVAGCATAQLSFPSSFLPYFCVKPSEYDRKNLLAAAVPRSSSSSASAASSSSYRRTNYSQSPPGRKYHYNQNNNYYQNNNSRRGSHHHSNSPSSSRNDRKTTTSQTPPRKQIVGSTPTRRRGVTPGKTDTSLLTVDTGATTHRESPTGQLQRDSSNASSPKTPYQQHFGSAGNAPLPRTSSSSGGQQRKNSPRKSSPFRHGSRGRRSNKHSPASNRSTPSKKQEKHHQQEKQQEKEKQQKESSSSVWGPAEHQRQESPSVSSNSGRSPKSQETTEPQQQKGGEKNNGGVVVLENSPSPSSNKNKNKNKFTKNDKHHHNKQDDNKNNGDNADFVDISVHQKWGHSINPLHKFGIMHFSPLLNSNFDNSPPSTRFPSFEDAYEKISREKNEQENNSNTNIDGDKNIISSVNNNRHDHLPPRSETATQEFIDENLSAASSNNKNINTTTTTTTTTTKSSSSPLAKDKTENFEQQQQKQQQKNEKTEEEEDDNETMETTTTTDFFNQKSDLEILDEVLQALHETTGSGEIAKSQLAVDMRRVLGPVDIDSLIYRGVMLGLLEVGGYGPDSYVARIRELRPEDTAQDYMYSNDSNADDSSSATAAAASSSSNKEVSTSSESPQATTTSTTAEKTNNKYEKHPLHIPTANTTTSSSPSPSYNDNLDMPHPRSYSASPSDYDSTHAGETAEIWMSYRLNKFMSKSLVVLGFPQHNLPENIRIVDVDVPDTVFQIRAFGPFTRSSDAVAMKKKFFRGLPVMPRYYPHPPRQ